MNITRNNYEEFFMLYADNELPAAARKEVEAFVAANPDLKQELALFEQFKLSPDAAVIFTGKEALMKQENNQEAISLTNYELFFVLYADDELANGEKAAVEDFVYHHPQLQAAFELIQQVKLHADKSIVFENKESLYRKEEDDRVVPFRWWKIAVAAMIVLMAGAFWMYQSKKANSTAGGNMAVTEGKKEAPEKNTPVVTNPQQPSLNNKEDKENADTNSNAQPVKESLVTTGAKKESRQVKNTNQPNAVAANDKKKDSGQPVNETGPQVPSVKEESVAYQETEKLTGTTVSSITNQPVRKAVIHTEIAAAASKSVKDQALIYTGSGESDNVKAVPAVATNEDQLEVLNTSVDTKNSLRGFFRKATRLISKKSSDSDEDSKRKSILIGGFEIAVR